MEAICIITCLITWQLYVSLVPLCNTPSYGGAWGGLNRQLTANGDPMSLLCDIPALGEIGEVFNFNGVSCH